MQIPWWAMIFSILVLPLLQPITDYGSQQLQVRLGLKPTQQQMQQIQQQPYIVFHNGEWWKYENNQWLVWRQSK